MRARAAASCETVEGDDIPSFPCDVAEPGDCWWDAGAAGAGGPDDRPLTEDVAARAYGEESIAAAIIGAQRRVSLLIRTF
jgi:hypothetical protein